MAGGSIQGVHADTAGSSYVLDAGHQNSMATSEEETGRPFGNQLVISEICLGRRHLGFWPFWFSSLSLAPDSIIVSRNSHLRHRCRRLLRQPLLSLKQPQRLWNRHQQALHAQMASGVGSLVSAVRIGWSIIHHFRMEARR